MSIGNQSTIGRPPLNRASQRSRHGLADALRGAAGSPEGFGRTRQEPGYGGLDLPREDDQHRALERVELVGEYPSVEAYFKAQLDPEVNVACLWLLDCLDMTAVLQRFSDGGRYRYVIEGGEVYRVGLGPPNPPDPVGPWMPTRGP